MPNLLGALFYGGYVLTRYPREKRIRSLLFFCLGAAIPGGLYMLYNYARFGTIMDKGYNLTHLKDLYRDRYNQMQTLPKGEQLAFLKAAVSEGPSGVKERYLLFLDNTNVMLSECGMMKIYPVNPYESFILLCILSMDPLTTFNDVWELSVK